MGLLELVTAITFIVAGNSYHFDRDQDMNENNRIRGIEFNIEDSNFKPFVKFFNNSFGQPSQTVGFNYENCWGNKFKMCGGYTAGIANGYVDEDVNPFPYIAPLSIIKYKNLELGISCLPVACEYEFKIKVDF